MRELSLQLWAWSASNQRFWRHDGHVIELGVLAGALVAGASLVVPLWLAFAMVPDDHPVNRLLEACQQGMRRGPFVLVGYAAVGLLTAWATVVLARLTWRGGRELVGIRRQMGMLARRSEEIELCAGGVAMPVRLLAMDVAVAFSSGLLRPRVYVSTTLLRRLSASELEATLLHERAHVRRRDPLRCWLVELVVWSLRFPCTSWLGLAHRAARESRADTLVAAGMGDDRPLLQALVKVDALAPIPGSCHLTSERERALRQVRNHGLVVGPRERAALVLGLSLVVAMMFVAFAGLSDWQAYWFCPNETSMQV